MVIITLNANIPVKRKQWSDWTKIEDIGTKIHIIQYNVNMNKSNLNMNDSNLNIWTQSCLCFHRPSSWSLHGFCHPLLGAIMKQGEGPLPPSVPSTSHCPE